MYVTYEISELLKDLGFDQPTTRYYVKVGFIGNTTKEIKLFGGSENYKPRTCNKQPHLLPAPTIGDVMYWLLVKYNKCVCNNIEVATTENIVNTIYNILLDILDNHE